MPRKTKKQLEAEQAALALTLEQEQPQSLGETAEGSDGLDNLDLSEAKELPNKDQKELDDLAKAYIVLAQEKKMVADRLNTLKKTKASFRTAKIKQNISNLEVAYNVLTWMENVMMDVKLGKINFNLKPLDGTEQDNTGDANETDSVHTEAGDGTSENTGDNGSDASI